MIQDRKTLKEFINADLEYYNAYPLKRRLRFAITNDHVYLIKKYIKLLRKEEYFFYKKGLLALIIEYFYAYRKNNLGNKLGFYIRPNSVDKGITLYHHGSIIVHDDARIGKNCKFHGANCIGNNGINNAVPTIGDNVDIGFGAIIIGDIVIGNNITIAAGSVVTTSFIEDNLVIAGVPARIVRRKNGKECIEKLVH